MALFPEVPDTKHHLNQAQSVGSMPNSYWKVDAEIIPTTPNG